MNVIALKTAKPRPAKAGVTVFMHLRQTSLIAHLAPQRRAIDVASFQTRSGRKIT